MVIAEEIIIHSLDSKSFSGAVLLLEFVAVGASEPNDDFSEKKKVFSSSVFVPWVINQGDYECMRAIIAKAWMSMFLVVVLMDVGREELKQRRANKRVKDQALVIADDRTVYQKVIEQEAEIHKWKRLYEEEKKKDSNSKSLLKLLEKNSVAVSALLVSDNDADNLEF